MPNQFLQENVFNNAPDRRIAIAMNTKPAFILRILSGIKNLISDKVEYSEVGKQLSILMLQVIANVYVYITTMKAMNFEDVIPSIPIDKFKNHYGLVLDLTPIQDATEFCHSHH